VKRAASAGEIASGFNADLTSAEVAECMRKEAGLQDAEIVIVGGGIIGCAIAYYLARRGREPLIIERCEIGCEASGVAAGGLWPQHYSGGSGIFLELCLQSNAMFDELASELRALTNVDIELLHGGLLQLLFTEEEVAEAEAVVGWQRARGLEVEWLTAGDAIRHEPAINPDILGAVFFPHDDQVGTLQLTQALHCGARKAGARSWLRTCVEAVEVAAGRVVAVETSRGRVACDVVVNAAGPWAGEVGQMIGSEVPVIPVRGQILCTEPLPPLLHSCLITEEIYLVQKNSGCVIVGSTRERVGFSKAVTAEALDAFVAGAIRAVPILGRAHFMRAWAGLRPFAEDELPILGPVDGVRGFINATAHFRNGVLLAPITGKIISELIVEGRSSFPLEQFTLERFKSHRN